MNLTKEIEEQINKTVTETMLSDSEGEVYRPKVVFKNNMFHYFNEDPSKNEPLVDILKRKSEALVLSLIDGLKQYDSEKYEWTFEDYIIDIVDYEIGDLGITDRIEYYHGKKNYPLREYLDDKSSKVIDAIHTLFRG